MTSYSMPEVLLNLAQVCMLVCDITHPREALKDYKRIVTLFICLTLKSCDAPTLSLNKQVRPCLIPLFLCYHLRSLLTLFDLH